MKFILSTQGYIKPSLWHLNKLISHLKMKCCKFNWVSIKESFQTFCQCCLSNEGYLHSIKLMLIVFFGTIIPAYLFILAEGNMWQNEQRIVERDLRKDRYQLIRELRNLSVEMPSRTSDGEWEGEAVRKVLDFETKLIDAYQKHALIVTNQGDKIWTMWNAIVYCATIYTTIGYGHIYPTTTTGRALTIVYSIIGIPLFLIALTDFGKLFTRGIKFLWSFVRRVYYTGSCRRVRKSGHVQEIFKGAQLMYDIATFRRASNQEPATDPENPEAAKSQNSVPTTAISEDATPTTPAISNYEIDDEFNLPISVALFILITYIFCGALIYSVWEQWDFFASFYFVFISMSTIGFGDFVPKHPICMIVSIVYLVFGLALMSMCINVVQLKLSDTFQQASAKLGASIGFEVDDSGSIITVDNVTGAAKAELLVPDSNIISPPTPVHKPSRNVPNSTAFPSTAATPSNFNTPDSDFAASTPGNPATEDNSSKNSD
nr:TWiK family of potassium channels protein 18 isoform X3 [Leptinotarsa decemlineata]XP_023029021.1 TWiK family of potassium channels protein 18 isoform X3 [Leptinotarsa decemlineata]